jgi:hypothetical protein
MVRAAATLVICGFLTACMTHKMLLKEAPSRTENVGAWTFRFLSRDDEEKVRLALDDPRVDGGMKRRLLGVLDQIDRGWIPEGMNQSQLMNNAFCAWTAARARSLLLGLDDASIAADGLAGDAWSFQVSVPAHGGRVVWRQGDGTFGAASLAAGDLIGIYYTESIYNKEIRAPEALECWPVTYTHLAYVALAMGDDALVIHDFRAPWTSGPRPWPVRIELLSRMMERFSGLFEPRIVLRPKSSI